MKCYTGDITFNVMFLADESSVQKAFAEAARYELNNVLGGVGGKVSIEEAKTLAAGWVPECLIDNPGDPDGRGMNVKAALELNGIYITNGFIVRNSAGEIVDTIEYKDAP